MTTDLGNAAHDLIFNIGKIGDDFKKLGIDMVDVVLHQMVELGLKELFKWLAGGPGLIGSLGGALSGLGTGIASTSTIITNLADSTSKAASAATDMGNSIGKIISSVADLGKSATSGPSQGVR